MVSGPLLGRMKCPNCNKRAISFVSWAVANRWIRWRCPHCGTNLKVSRRTLKAILGILILLPFMIWAEITICRAYAIVDQRRQDLVFVAMAGPILLGVAYWDWKTGYYARRDEPNTQPSSRN